MRFEETLNKAAREAHKCSVEHGFYDEVETIMDFFIVQDDPEKAVIVQRDFVLSQLAKIASEVGEAVEVIQKNAKWEGLNEELADITIRTMDLAAFIGYDHGTDVYNKMMKNRNRPRMHGKLC